MGIRDFFRRSKTDDKTEHHTNQHHAKHNTEGSIFDVITDEAGAITHVFYNYEINGVEYESSQLLDAGQRLRPGDYFPGARVTIRFNPHQPGNSLVV